MKTGRYLQRSRRERAKRQVKFLRVRLRRLMRDVRRKMAALPALAESSVARIEVHAKGAPGISRTSSAAIADTFIPGTRRKPSASARARRARRTNSAAKFPSPQICIRPRAGILFCRRARCTAIRTMATR